MSQRARALVTCRLPLLSRSIRKLLIDRTADYREPGENMLAQPVDPRDQRWEVPRPIYRVHFWENPAPERTDGMWTAEEWRLENADIDEVLAWAQAKAASRRFVVYVEVTGDQHDDLGLIRLLGADPADS